MDLKNKLDKQIKECVKVFNIVLNDNIILNKIYIFKKLLIKFSSFFFMLYYRKN